MAKSVEVHINGLDELQKTLEKIPKEVADKIFKQTLKEQGKRVQEAFADAAPKDTGFLAEHFNVKVRVQRENIAGSSFVGPAKADYPVRGGDKVQKKSGRTIWAASVARYLEFGTSKMAAKPFMRPAWNSIKDSVLQGIIKGIQERLRAFTK